MSVAPPPGRLHSVNVSQGGVPKHAIPSAAVTGAGIEGDACADLRHHGGPDRAVSLFSLEVIELLQREGHPIVPGSTGENLTLEGLDWSRVVPGARLELAGGVVLEVTSYCTPCRKIARSFRGGEIERIGQREHPGESRVYARVLVEGRVTAGEGVRIVAPG